MRTDSAGRALQLLSLLQTHRFWPCAELATRLGVTERTVRRDLDRLRELGYPVDSISGKYGGYRLAAGSHIPPLVLDDEEAIAVAIGLRYAAEAAVSGIEETSLRALVKIEALLPHRLRRRVSALHSSVASLRRTAVDDVIHPESLSVFAAACRDHEYVRFGYRRSQGESSRRHVEPHQLVTAGRRWYLVAWDEDRRDWRTFRLDRIQEPRPVGSHFTLRTIPGGDAADFVASSIGLTAREHDATIVIHRPFAEIEGVLRWADHTLREEHAEHCVVRIRSEDLGRLAMTVAEIALAAPVTVIEPAELSGTIERLTTHLAGP
ncbi:helix-turn-helix transcriptional regulator [Microbacterium sp. LWH12-1.2]|uniref:helix-turn-helix transcriptional regulator n=1 Tax=Microbacterium sp. LWH12-1.2 TaxID=3135259 RepID=UPI003412E0FA